MAENNASSHNTSVFLLSVEVDGEVRVPSYAAAQYRRLAEEVNGTVRGAICKGPSRRIEVDRLAQDRSHLPLNTFANQRAREFAVDGAILMLRNCLFWCVFLSNLFFSSGLGGIHRQESGRSTLLRRTFCKLPVRFKVSQKSRGRRMTTADWSSELKSTPQHISFTIIGDNCAEHPISQR